MYVKTYLLSWKTCVENFKHDHGTQSCDFQTFAVCGKHGSKGLYYVPQAMGLSDDIFLVFDYNCTFAVEKRLIITKVFPHLKSVLQGNGIPSKLDSLLKTHTVTVTVTLNFLKGRSLLGFLLSWCNFVIFPYLDRRINK